MRSYYNLFALLYFTCSAQAAALPPTAASPAWTSITPSPELEGRAEGWQAHRDAALSKAREAARKHADHRRRDLPDAATTDTIRDPAITTPPPDVTKRAEGWQANRDAAVSKAREAARKQGDNNRNGNGERKGWQAKLDAALSKAREAARKQADHRRDLTDTTDTATTTTANATPSLQDDTVTITPAPDITKRAEGWQANRDAAVSKAREAARKQGDNNRNGNGERKGWQAKLDAALSKAREAARKQADHRRDLADANAATTAQTTTATITAAPELEGRAEGWQAHRDAALSKAREAARKHADHRRAVRTGTEEDSASTSASASSTATLTTTSTLWTTATITAAAAELEARAEGWQAHRDAALSKAREAARKHADHRRREVDGAEDDGEYDETQDDVDFSSPWEEDEMAWGVQQHRHAVRDWRDDVERAKSLASSYKSEYGINRQGPETTTVTSFTTTAETVPPMSTATIYEGEENSSQAGMSAAAGERARASAWILAAGTTLAVMAAMFGLL